MPRRWSLPNSVYDVLSTKLDSIAHDFPEGRPFEEYADIFASTLDERELRAWRKLSDRLKRNLFSEIGLIASVRRIASKLLKKGEPELAREVLALQRREPGALFQIKISAVGPHRNWNFHDVEKQLENFLSSKGYTEVIVDVEEVS